MFSNERDAVEALARLPLLKPEDPTRYQRNLKPGDAIEYRTQGIDLVRLVITYEGVIPNESPEPVKEEPAVNTTPEPVTTDSGEKKKIALDPTYYILRTDGKHPEGVVDLYHRILGAPADGSRPKNNMAITWFKWNKQALDRKLKVYGIKPQ